MLGAALEVGFARRARTEGLWWALGLEGRLRLSWNRSDVAATPARARFELLAAALEACPLHAGAGRVRLGLCGVLEAGALGGEGIAIAHPRWGRAPWLAVGGGAQVELFLTRRWQVVAGGQLTRPLQQTRFVFAEPSLPVSQTAGAALSGALALMARFP
jgi:hypothetical protein